jgi:3',5'-cyclic AMP phosphodiesterase CpdA
MHAPLFSFGLVADCQYADIDDVRTDGMDRRYRSAPARLAEAVAQFNRHDLAFVLHLGDLIDQDLANMPIPRKVLAGLRAPVHHVLGNHDFAGALPGQVNARQDVLGALGLDRPYYRFTLPGWRFLVLDTNEVGVIEHDPHTPAWQQGQALLDQLTADGRVNAQPWNGTIGAAQRAWLHRELRDAAAGSANSESPENIVVFAHHGLAPEHHDNLLEDREMLAELGDYPHLRAWINGHNHAGAYAHIGDLHCLTLHGMVETATNAFALVHAYADRLEVVGYGREPNRTLTW